MSGKSSYLDLLVSQGATFIAPMGDQSGTATLDTVGGLAGTYNPNAAGAWTGGTLGSPSLLARQPMATVPSFNGSTGRADFTTPPTHAAGTAFSVSAWINPANITTNGYILCIHQTLDLAIDFVFNMDGASLNGRLNCSIITTGTSLQVNATLLTANAWQHVAVTHDGTLTATGTKLYVNGAEAGTYTQRINGTVGFISTGGSWSIGARIFDNIRNFAGLIGPLAAFNLKVLTALEIQAQYLLGLYGRNPNAQAV